MTQNMQLKLAAATALIATGLVAAGITTAFQRPETVEVPVPVYIERTIEVPVEVPVVEQQTVYVPVATDLNAFPLTDSERLAVERCVVGEMGCGTLEDMIGVAQVIRDRAEHANQNLYGGPTVTGVLSIPNAHYTEWCGDPADFPLVQKAVSLVFDYGFRLFDETTVCYFNPETSDPVHMELLRKYEYVGSTTYSEFRSDKLIMED